MSDWAFRFDPAVPAAALVPAAAAAAAFFAWTYRRAAAETSRRLARALLAMRLGAILLVAMALMGPVLRVFYWTGARGAVAVLADDTESLGIPDASLGSRRLTRLEALKELLGGERGLAARISRTAGVHLFAWGESLRRIDSLDEVNGSQGQTDLAGALSGAVSASAGGERTVAVLLVSDGADTAGGDVEAAIARLATGGVPVYAVAVGGGELSDIEVVDVRATRLARKDTLVSVVARVRSRGLPPVRLPVRLVEVPAGAGASDGDAAEARPGSLVAEQVVEVSGAPTTASFEFLPAEAGFREYAVEVPVQEGEAIARNNRRQFALTVERRKIRVLYMEGTQYRRPGQKLWEFQFLEEALREDGDVEITSLLRDKVESAREAGIYTVKDPVRGYPRTRKGLFEYDVIISSDIDIDFFTPEQMENTVDFVARRGGGFVMIGGWTAFGPGGYDESVIDKMLPVDMMGRKRESYVEDEPFQPKVTDDGYRHPIMQLDPDPERNRAIWELLPDFMGFNRVQRAKPAATALAVHEDEKYRGLYGPAVIVAVQQYGRGRSMAFTTDTTAGWGTFFEEGFGEGDNRYYKKFWQNAVRWLAEYRLKAPSRLVQLEIPGAVIGRGAPQRVHVRALDEEYEPASGAAVTLRVTDPDGKTGESSLAADPARPGEYSTGIVFDALGRHTLEATATLAGSALGSDRVAVSVRPSENEFERPEADVALLRRIAERTGGKFYEADEAAVLAEDVSDLVASMRRHRDEPLWDSFWGWLALVALLTAEWFVRKRAGLP